MNRPICPKCRHSMLKTERSPVGGNSGKTVYYSLWVEGRKRFFTTVGKSLQRYVNAIANSVVAKEHVVYSRLGWYKYPPI